MQLRISESQLRDGRCMLAPATALPKQGSQESQSAITRRQTPRIDRPNGTLPRQINRLNAAALLLYHAGATLALLPYFFSWTGVAVALVGVYLFGTVGVNLCYHRLLAHRGLVCPKWLEHVFALLGVCSFQESPARWVAIHRRHHEHADEQPDPHSPLVSFYWGHMQWIYTQNRELGRLGIFERYAKDILRDKFYATLERSWLWMILASWILMLAIGAGAALIAGAELAETFRMALSVLVWGIFVRTVVVWHITWSVNSVTHRWGYRNYKTDDHSRNNIALGIISNGEGWHNNHHVDPSSARHGHQWWEIDVTWSTIRLLEMSGLARRVVRPSPHIVATLGRDSDIVGERQMRLTSMQEQ